MNANTEQFFSRWVKIEKETLSSVRRQLKNYTFDISSINADFQTSCNEWFTGSLAPSLWFTNLTERNPTVAQDFQHYVREIQLECQKPSSPNRLWIYVITAISLPLTYGVLALITDWWTIGKLAFSIGIATLTLVVCQTLYQKRIDSYHNKIIDSFKEQLKRHGETLSRLLQ